MSFREKHAPSIHIMSGKNIVWTCIWFMTKLYLALRSFACHSHPVNPVQVLVGIHEHLIRPYGVQNLTF